MVVHRKDIKKQNVKNQKIFFLGKTVFQKTIQRIVSNTLQKRQKKDIKKET